MKKIFTFVCALLLAIAGMAQTHNAKLNIMVGNFTGDYSHAQRVNFINELSTSHRANVIEQGAYNALPQEVRDKMHIDIVLTGKCTMTTEQKESTTTDKSGTKKTVITYESKLTTDVILTNPATHEAIAKPVFESSHTDEDRATSIAKAVGVGFTKGKVMLFVAQILTLDEYLQEIFPLHGKVVTLNEAKKNKAESVTINLGARDAVYRSETFEVVATKNGKEKNYGRLRVREINSDTSSTLRVEKGGKEIFKAMEEGTELSVVSYVQAISLNGIVRADNDAPRLNISSPDEAKKRNVALGAIVGGAPSNFVSAVKENLKSNRRVNAYELGAAGCPATGTLDGIACGYFAGMESSSRLVKAEDNLLQFKDYTEYSTTVSWYLFIVDPRTGDIVYAGNQGTTSTSDKSAEAAQSQAIQSASVITSATYSAYPLIGTVLTVDEADTKKAKEVTIDLGSDYPVYKGLDLDVYSRDANDGWEKIGRIRVTGTTDGTHATCTVRKGGEAILKALTDGEPTRITTYILKGVLEI